MNRHTYKASPQTPRDGCDKPAIVNPGPIHGFVNLRVITFHSWVGALWWGNMKQVPSCFGPKEFGLKIALKDRGCNRSV